jgi:FkbM family methyltransferase
LDKKHLLSRPPWHFRLAKWMIRSNVRGGYRLLRIASEAGWLDCSVRYSLTDRITIGVPLYRESTRWDREDVVGYDVPTVDALAAAIDRMPQPVVFVDCGADIGVMSIRVASRTGNIARFIGIEPNRVAFEWLVENYQNLPTKAQARFGAIGKQTGQGELKSPEHSPDSDHAKFIAPTAGGTIPIFRIDDLGIEAGQCVVLKLDLEGGELDAVEGAVETLAKAARFIVDIEAHPQVVRRTGTDPTVILRRLNDIRPCEFLICERPDVQLVLDRDFFSQVKDRNHDIIAVSTC